jgi:hypothetical protein
MTEQLMLTAQSHQPEAPQPLDSSHNSAQAPTQGLFSEGIGFADPSTIRHAAENGGIIESQVEEASSVPNGEPYNRSEQRPGFMPRTEEPAQQARPSSPKFGPFQPQAFNLSDIGPALNIRPVNIPRNRKDAAARAVPEVSHSDAQRNPEIKTREQLREAYGNRLNSIMGGQFAHLVESKYANASDAELEYLCHLASVKCVEQPDQSFELPDLDQLQAQYAADKEYEQAFPGSSFENLAARETEGQKQDALRSTLYAEAIKYYSADALRANGYNHADMNVLNGLIQSARIALAGDNSVPDLQRYVIQRPNPNTPYSAAVAEKSRQAIEDQLFVHQRREIRQRNIARATRQLTYAF